MVSHRQHADVSHNSCTFPGFCGVRTLYLDIDHSYRPSNQRCWRNHLWPFHFHLPMIALPSKLTNWKFQLLCPNLNDSSRIDHLELLLYFSSLRSLKKAISGHWTEIFPVRLFIPLHPTRVSSRNPESGGFQNKPAEKPHFLQHLDVFLSNWLIWRCIHFSSAPTSAYS